MTSKFAMIAKIESILLILLAVSMIPSLLIAIFNNETNSMYAFIITILICTAVGVIIRLRFKLSRYNLKNRDGFLIVSLSWFLISFLGAFPFWICPVQVKVMSLTDRTADYAKKIVEEHIKNGRVVAEYTIGR